MATERKTTQLQLRVSPSEKAAIARAAKREGTDISSYVLKRIIPNKNSDFQKLLTELNHTADRSYAFASLNGFLKSLRKHEFLQAVEEPTLSQLNEFDANYVAAMVEHAAHQKKLPAPKWTKTIQPLKNPFFGSELSKLHLYLLLSSPVAFRRRNIFIDATVGHRV